MELFRGYKFPIYPNKKQKEKINQIFISCNFVYNHFINEHKKSYQETGKILTLSECIKQLPKLKKEYPQLKEAESTALQQSIRRLDRAYSKYFKHYTRYPRYKSNKFNKSYTCTKNGCVPSNIRLEEESLILPKLGRVKINLHHDLPENIDIKSATVKLDNYGHYSVTLLIKEEVEVEEIREKSVLGLVYSPDYFFISSNGGCGNVPEKYYKTLRKIEYLKKSIKNKKRGSKNKAKEVIKLRKAYEKARNIKNDYLHKWSKEIVDNYSTVIIKKINPKIFDVKASSKQGWNQFIQFLRYKLEEKGGTLRIVSEEEFPLVDLNKDMTYEGGLERAKKLTTLIIN